MASSPSRGNRVRAKTGQGFQQRLKADRQKQQRLFAWYNTRLHPDNLLKQRFRFTGYLRNDQRTLVMNPYLTNMQWQDLSGQAWLGGTFAMNSIHNQRLQFKLNHGDVIRAEVFWSNAWWWLWDMRVWDPDRTLAAGNPQYNGNLYDDIYPLSLSMDNFHYTNVFCHEVLIRIAQRYKIPLGNVAMGTYKIKTFDDQGVSPLDAIISAYQQERHHTGRRFVMRWFGGRLNIVPLRRNPLLYTMHRQLVDTTLHHTTPQGFATALTGRTSIQDPKTGKTTKHSYTATHQVANYGYIHQQVDYTKNYNDAQLQKAVKHDLARRQIVGHSIDFDHPGIGLIRKGDAVEIVLPSEGYTGWKSLVWVSDITHTVSPGSYMMQPTIGAADPIGMPFVQMKSKNKQNRHTKRQQRARYAHTWHYPQPGGAGPTSAQASAIRRMLGSTA